MELIRDLTDNKELKTGVGIRAGPPGARFSDCGLRNRTQSHRDDSWLIKCVIIFIP